MSSKIVEANAGVHSLAMAVAVRLSLPYCLGGLLMSVSLLASDELEIIR
jgi:hypothetical protein